LKKGYSVVDVNKLLQEFTQFIWRS